MSLPPVLRNPPVAVLRVHAQPSVEAGVSGIRGAGLMGLLPSRAGAHGLGLHHDGNQAHGATVHHRGRVPHLQHAGAAAGAGALRTGTLVHPDLGHADLQEGLELERGETKPNWRETNNRHHLSELQQHRQYSPK